MEDAKETVREATVGKVNSMMSNAGRSASGVVDKIKEHPISAAMIGAGAWWLLNKLPDERSSYKSSYGSGDRPSYGSSSYGSPTSPYERQYGNFSGGARMADEEIGSGRSSSYGETSSAGSGYGQGAGDMARGVSETAADYASRGRERVSDMARGATETAAEYASRGRERVSDLADQTERQFDRWIRDNPLAVGAAAIAIGAAIGMALPETQRERDRLVGKAQEMATEKVEQVASSLPGGDAAGGSGTGRGSSGGGDGASGRGASGGGASSGAGSSGGSGAGGAQPGNA
jgi:ElaB/YqjD/DUF883 family membrane-anchored ribosome-binding protein